MSCLELVILILVAGFVSMIEICVVAICIGRVLDDKLKTKTQMEIKMLEKEMETINKMIEKYFERLEKIFNKEEPPAKKIGFAKNGEDE